MKKSMVMVLAVMMGALLVLTTGQVFSAQKAFSLDDIPEIENKTPLTLPLEAGGEEDTLIPFVKAFSVM